MARTIITRRLDMDALQNGDEEVGEPVGGADGRAFVVGADGEGHATTATTAASRNSRPGIFRARVSAPFAAASLR